ncbi:TonB-dependent siderophore receptor [Aliterella atlantica]|uniref:Ferrichrome-iron receptor n=1 Tax=Aliterella atlantica CENA595 TaxID=1618023 RepID=A0A0D8ZQJ9_9CYAN|nr:TonB-dependent siderophore receptor [Aliterella atlantica]KJH70627.1 ferrichrome-iron receptor [Aliterella atlantica CENA595]
MKPYQFFFNLLLKSTLPLAVSFASITVLLSTPATSEELGDEISKNIAQLGDSKIPAQNSRVLAQTPTQENTVVVITGVTAKSTDQGLEVIFASNQGEQLQVTNRSTGNNFVADITGGQLRLPNGDGFTYRSENPISGVTEITATNVDANTVRLTVVGENSLPKVELFDDDAGLVFAVASLTTAAKPPQTEEQPATETPPEEPAAPQNELEEVLVTGEQDSYRAPNASTATRTDTPVRDIPGSIQVIPRQILEDQKTTRIQEALENISGVRKEGNYGGTDAGGFNIRGFAQEGNFRNGLADNDFYSSVDPANIDRIEVLKGPASVLFGQSEPGGIVNVVTKQPLGTPYYSAEVNVGNYAFYRSSLDISGPLEDDGSLLYRLNAAYQNSGSFRDYNFTERVFVAPVFTLDISDRTSLTVDLEYQNNNYLFDRGLPSLGDRPAPIPISRLVGLPDSVYDDSTFRVGYRLEHQFSENWQLRNGFSLVSAESAGNYATGGNELVDDQFAPIYIGRDDFTREIYTLQTEVVGRFNTGSIVHQPLIGVELRRNIWAYNLYDVPDPILLDIFNPDYDVDLPDIPDEKTSSYTTRRDTLGIYLQDQIAFTDNLKVLVGGRFDAFYRRDNFGTPEEENLSAFSPRVGIVYQPIQPISLYASYTQSFQPDRFLDRSAVTNEPFKPTEGTQYEVGIKADISDRLSATLAAYEITKTNVITADPIDPDLSIQVGEQRSRGVELDVGGEIQPGWNIIASYTYTDAITSEDNTIAVGNRLINVPEHAASLWTTYEIQTGDLEGLGFGLGLYYVGDRFADLDNTSVLPSYFRTDSAIYYKRDNWRVALNFRNLFNQTYYETAQTRNIIYPGAPFTVIGSFAIEF